MSKKVLQQKDVIVKLIVGAGQASPSPPVGPALGSKGVKSMDFCKVTPSSHYYPLINTDLCRTRNSTPAQQIMSPVLLYQPASPSARIVPSPSNYEHLQQLLSFSLRLASG